MTRRGRTLASQQPDDLQDASVDVSGRKRGRRSSPGSASRGESDLVSESGKLSGLAMKFMTQAECEEWLSGVNRILPTADETLTKLRYGYPGAAYLVYSFASWFASNATYRWPALLWITEWGVWPSSENLHLYYRLRQSYGDYRLLNEAPGHSFPGTRIRRFGDFPASRHAQWVGRMRIASAGLRELGIQQRRIP